MDSLALIQSFGEFKDEKNIDRITLMAILEESLSNILKKKFGEDNFDIIVNPDKGDLEIWRNRVVVEDGMSEDDNSEIELSEARKIEPDFEVGEDVSEEVKLVDIGRRNILALRQQLISKILEHDNSNTFNKFKESIGEIVNGEVHHIHNRNIIIMDDEQNEMILPRDSQISSDFFRKGDTVRAIIEDVVLRGSKTQIFLSRTSPKFLEKLFEQEIPEIFDGLITVKKVVRIPGEKAKVVVESYDDRIDPVGACVGVKGSRIFPIVKELKNENIDVINFTNNQQLYISRLLSPAKFNKVEINDQTKKVYVHLNVDEVSKAIGRGGQNIKLASQLLGYDIEVMRESSIGDDVELMEFVDEIDEWIINEFRKIGLDTAKSVLEKDLEELVARIDLEEETIINVIQILKEEFSNE